MQSMRYAIIRQFKPFLLWVQQQQEKKYMPVRQQMASGCRLYWEQKNHAVIMPDASKQKTLDAIIGAAFGASGQRCMAISVAVVVGGAKAWIPELVDRATKLTVGCGSDPDTEIGPLISIAAKNRVLRIYSIRNFRRSKSAA